MADTVIDPIEYGKLLAKVTQLESEVVNLRADMKLVLQTLQEAQGGWKIMMLLGGASAAMGALVVKAIPYLR